jgi:hypothetical protein|tara:strand:- start:757 stop:990 length:234 start_codon:yes stop_codon:yes gene_type:complete
MDEEGDRMKLNKKHKAMREKKALQWDNRTSNLSFKLHPLNRKEGIMRSYYPCGHHINFPSRECHEDNREELLGHGLI